LSTKLNQKGRTPNHKLSTKSDNKEHQIPVQCPDCGELIRINGAKQLYCIRCNRFFDENEIRRRCGL